MRWFVRAFASRFSARESSICLRVSCLTSRISPTINAASATNPPIMAQPILVF